MLKTILYSSSVVVSITTAALLTYGLATNVNRTLMLPIAIGSGVAGIFWSYANND